MSQDRISQVWKLPTLPTPDISFRNIRKHRTSQNDGFEELTRQLVLADPPTGYTSIENRGPGADGGVEILVKFADGRCWGWQSKYFLDSFAASEVAQLKKSFSAALSNFPTLEKYLVAIPRNLSGPAGSKRDSQTKHWNDFKTWCQSEASNAGRAITVELWDDSYFVSKLQRSDAIYSGMRSYWFDVATFDKDWFQRQLSKSFHYIGKRYRPDDHVEVRISNPIRVLRRDEGFDERLKSVMDAVAGAIKRTKQLERNVAQSDPLVGQVSALATLLETISDSLSNCDTENLYTPQLAETLIQVAEIRSNNEAFRAILDARYKRIEKTDPKTKKKEFKYLYSDDVRYNIDELLLKLGSAGSEFTTAETGLLRNPCLIIEGEAGVGKSHLLANEVESHLKAENFALFVPARVLDHGDKPEQEILQHFDVNDLRFETFLAAFQCAALASGKPALLVIDALNESHVARGWEAGLPSLIFQVQKFSQVALCVSNRTSYRKLCIRESLDVPRVSHHGFRGHLGEAAKEYLDRNGIERPSAPIFGLNEILYNPLFLSTAVDYMKSKKLTSFPRGLDSIATLMTFWLGVVEQKLVDKGFERISLDDGKLSRTMQALASAMAVSGSENIEYEEANAICERIVGLAPPTKQPDQLLHRLIDEGMLLDFPDYKSGTGKHVTFGFQKFSDYFIADAIIRECKTPEVLATELKKKGKFKWLFSDARYDQFAGPRIALLALTHARFGKELPNIEKYFFKNVHISVDEFIASLSWRQASDITTETVEMLERQRGRLNGKEQLVSDNSWFSLLLEMAPLPNCLINASYLKRHLASLSLGVRDATWSLFLVGKSEVYEDEWSVIQQLIDWAWVGPKAEIAHEMVHQVAITLALMTSTTDRKLRDCATKAITSLLIKYPNEIVGLIHEFADWDDSYIRERVLAAASAGVLYCSDIFVLQEAAKAADLMVFRKKPVELHAWTRRYAQIIVDHAMFNGAAIDEDAKLRCIPPYASEPIKNWPSLDKIAPQYESARSIFSSVVGYVSEPFDGKRPMIAGDFGRYTMGGIDNNFSEVMRGVMPPLKREQEITQFWSKVSALGQKVKAIQDSLMLKSKERSNFDLSLLMKTLPKGNDDGEVDDSELKKFKISLEIEFSETETNFMALLPSGLRTEYTALKPLDRYHNRGVPTFSLLQGQCWVFQRAVQLGWQQPLHEEIEKNQLRYTHGRHDHRVERIGKKYQHIAFAELTGYLADHHWYLNWDDEPSILDKLEKFDRADIDPTYLSGTFSKPIQNFLPEPLRTPKMAFVPKDAESNMAWARTLEDIPDPTQFLIQADAEGREWFMQHCFCKSDDYTKNFETIDPIRGAQYSVEMILVSKQEIGKLKHLTTVKIKENNHDVFDNSFSSSDFIGQRSYRHIFGNQKIQLSNQAADFMFARVTQSYSPKYSELDQSGVSDDNNFSTPHPAILSKMMLRPKDAWSSFFVTEDNSTAFCETPEFMGGTAVIRRDVMEQFADANGLQVVWRVWVEKDGGLGTNYHTANHRQFVRQDFIGFYYKEKGKWSGELVSFRD